MSKVELVGGPRDGQFVDDLGPRFLEPARRDVGIVLPVAPAVISHLDFPSSYDCTIPVAEYEKRIDARDGLPRYVYRGERRS